MITFICSLPRSKTGWIANFLTYGPSFCFHELCGRVNKLSEYPAALRSASAPFVSVSDSGNLFAIDRLIELFPHCRLVVVRRDRMDVDRSLRKLGFEITDTLAILDEDLDRIEKIYASRVLSLDFERLDARALWSWCVPGIPINELRLSMLETLNVQIKPTVLHESVKRSLPGAIARGSIFDLAPLDLGEMLTPEEN